MTFLPYTLRVWHLHMWQQIIYHSSQEENPEHTRTVVSVVYLLLSLDRWRMQREFQDHSHFQNNI